MAILVMCTNPDCGELFDVADTAAGTEVTCPACGAPQTITSQAPAAPTEAPAATTEAPAAAEPALPEPTDEIPAAPRDEPSVEFVPVDAGPQADRPRNVQPAAPAPAAQGPPTEAEPEPEAPPADEPAPEAGESPAYQTVDELDTGLDREWGEMFSIAEPSPQTAAPEPGEQGEQGVLEHRPAAAAVVMLALVGMGGGAVAGLAWIPLHLVLAVYLGAIGGWVVGFVLGLLMVLAVDRPEESKVRCGVCRALCRVEAELCPWCGSPVGRQVVDPMVAGGLSAWEYALSSLRSVLVLTVMPVAAYLLYAGADGLAAMFPGALEPWRPVGIALGAALGLGILGYWMEYMLTAAGDTIRRGERAPSSQNPLSPANIAAVGKLLAVLGMYVVPVFTLGLLPMGLLVQATPQQGGALNPLRTARLAWKCPKDFVVLWLVWLLWSAAAVLACIVVLALYGLTESLPSVGGASQVALKTTLGALTVGVLSWIACLYGLMVFRCVGLFGRLNARALFAKPADEE